MTSINSGNYPCTYNDTNEENKRRSRCYHSTTADRLWTNGQILTGIKDGKSMGFLRSVSVQFGSSSQTVLRLTSKKFQIYSIWGQCDPIWWQYLHTFLTSLSNSLQRGWTLLYVQIILKLTQMIKRLDFAYRWKSNPTPPHSSIYNTPSPTSQPPFTTSICRQ